jgi:hypothetical protein
MSIIILRGFSHSGKDFIGQILCDKYGYKRFAFADSLKKIVANEFGCPLEQLHTQEGKLEICEKDLLKRTYRQILIDEALRLRNIDSGIFAKYCCKEISESHIDSLPDKIVITDWRYPNELEIVNSIFCEYVVTPVHVIREGQLESPVKDISEYHLDDRKSDYKLHNKLDITIYDEIHILINYICSLISSHLT